MAMSAKHRSKFAALHQWWWRLHMSEKFLFGMNKQTKETNNQNSELAFEVTIKVLVPYTDSILESMMQIL